MVELHWHVKFGQNRSNRGPDMAIFRLLKMADRRYHGFKIFLKFLMVGQLKKGRTAAEI